MLLAMSAHEPASSLFSLPHQSSRRMPRAPALTAPILGLLLVFVLLLPACPREKDGSGEESLQAPPPPSMPESVQAPPAPSMPDGWEVRSDEVIPRDAVEGVEQRLGGGIAALRNTVYDVDGRRVQLNVILAAGDQDASRIMEALRAMKTEEALLRHDRTIYEFMGDDEVLPAIRQGRAHLERSLQHDD